MSTPPHGPPSGPPPPGSRSAPPGPPARRGLHPAQAVALGLAVVLVIVALIAALTSRGGGSGASNVAAKKEVFAEPVSTATNPFSPPVGHDYTNMAEVHTQGISTQVGGQPGLYGGTMHQGSCDKQQLVTFLQANPDKAYAWASTLGIQVPDIPAYVNTLTAVLLRADTRVTNHGYVNGHATAFQTVLQAGTAALIDDKGEPVMKCYCGNPLTPPIEYPPVYYGPKWDGFDPSSLTVVVQNTTIINVFTLIDPATGQAFTRPAGTDGAQDTPTNPPPTSTSTSTTTPLPTQPSTTPPSTSAGPTDDQRALAKLDRDAKACYPFRDIEQDVSENRTTAPGPDPSSLILRVVGTTASGATQTFTWQVDRQTFAFTPLDDLARRANNDCPALGSSG